MGLETVQKPSSRPPSSELEERRRQQAQASTPTTKSEQDTVPRYLRSGASEPTPRSPGQQASRAQPTVPRYLTPAPTQAATPTATSSAPVSAQAATTGLGQGKPLPTEAATRFSEAYGHDLSQVRVHPESPTPGAIGARAFTVGRDVAFAPGAYQPGTTEGQRLIGHELAHVVQQSRGTPKVQGKGLANGSPEHEADHAADAVLSGKPAPSLTPTGGASVQMKTANPSASAPQGARPIASQKAQPGEVDLSKGTLSGATLRISEGGKVMARLGGLAAGEIELEKKDGGYRTKGGGSAIPLTIPVINRVLGDRAVLVIQVEDDAISGYAALGKPGRVPAPPSRSALFNALIKDTGALALTGLANLNPPSIQNELSGGVLKVGTSGMRFSLSGFVTGTGELGFENDQMHFGGSAEVKVPGGSGGKLEVKWNPEKGLAGDAHLEISIGKVTGTADARLRQGALDIQGTASYAGDRLKGSITLIATDPKTARDITTQDPRAGQLPEPANPDGAGGATPGAAAASGAGATAPTSKPGPREFCGFGELDFALTDWFTGKAKVVINSAGQATVRGNISPPKEIILFEQKNWTKSLAKVEARAAYGIPVVGNVFVFANVGLEALATLGPGKLYNIQLQGQYSTDKRVDKELSLQASLNISAFAGLRLRAEGGAGLTILAHDIKAGVGVNALAGVRGYVEARPTIGYRQKAGAPGEFYIKGHMELAAQPFLGLGGDLFVEVDSPWWSPLPDKKWTWPLGSIEYPLPGEFGIGADVEHVLGSKTWPEVQFSDVSFDGGKFMSDLLSDSAPSKSGKGGDKKPAKWNEGGKGKGDKPSKGPDKGGKGPDAGAKGKPGKDTGKPGKNKGKTPGQKPNNVQQPFQMNGASHTLFVSLGKGAKVEMASRRELLSSKLGRAVGVVMQRQEDAKSAGAPDTVINLRAQAAALKELGGKAKKLQQKAAEKGISPDEAPKGGAATSPDSELKTLGTELANALSSYGVQYKVKDIDEILAEAKGLPKDVRVEKVALPKAMSPTLTTSIEGADSQRIHQGPKQSPDKLVPSLVARGAKFDPSTRLLTLPRPKPDELGGATSLKQIGAAAAQQTGMTSISLAKKTKTTFVISGSLDLGSAPSRELTLAYNESSGEVDSGTVETKANDRLEQLFAKWQKDVTNSKYPDKAKLLAFEGFTIDGKSKQAAKTPAHAALKKYVSEKHVSTVEALDYALTGDKELQAGFQNVPGTIIAKQASSYGVKRVAGDPDKDKFQQRIKEKTTYTPNEQLGRINTPDSSEGEHHEFEPLSVDRDESSDPIVVKYTTKKGQSFVVTVDKATGLTKSIKGTNLSLKGTGDPRNRGVTQDSPAYIVNENLNRSHLIADEFKGSGYTKGLNLITTSDYYNQTVMREAEKKIGSFISDNRAISFTLEVTVTWGELLDQSILKKITSEPWFAAEYKNSPDLPKLKAEIEAKLAKSPKLKRCLGVDYLAVITDAEDMAAIEDLTFDVHIDEDNRILLDKK